MGKQAPFLRMFRFISSWGDGLVGMSVFCSNKDLCLGHQNPLKKPVTCHPGDTYTPVPQASLGMNIDGFIITDIRRFLQQGTHFLKYDTADYFNFYALMYFFNA